jgi:hypothetical protein
MHVIVKLSANAAREVVNRKLRNLTGAEHVQLFPLARGADDEFRMYFALEVADLKTGNELAAEILAWPDVEASYVKPDDEPP